MDISRVKYNLGKQVRYGDRLFLLNACIMRQGSDGFYYQAELKDQTARSALVIADLNEIKEETP